MLTYIPFIITLLFILGMLKGFYRIMTAYLIILASKLIFWARPRITFFDEYIFKCVVDSLFCCLVSRNTPPNRICDEDNLWVPSHVTSICLYVAYLGRRRAVKPSNLHFYKEYLSLPVMG